MDDSVEEKVKHAIEMIRRADERYTPYASLTSLRSPVCPVCRSLKFMYHAIRYKVIQGIVYLNPSV